MEDKHLKDGEKAKIIGYLKNKETIVLYLIRFEDGHEMTASLEEVTALIPIETIVTFDSFTGESQWDGKMATVKGHGVHGTYHIVFEDGWRTEVKPDDITPVLEAHKDS